MSVLYDEGQQAIATESNRIIKARILPETLLGLLEQTGAYDTAFWDICKEQGWTGIALPEDYGGLGLGLLELGIVAQACGTATSGAAFLTSSFGAARAILDHATEEVKAHWLPGLASGEKIGAVAFAEGQSPCPTRPSVTFANGVLTGTKPAVSAGLEAAVAVVLAQGDDGPVLVLADLDGVARAALPTFDNSRCTAALTFSGTPGTLLASGPSAHEAALDILALQSVVTAHEQTGGAEAMMLRARDYANTRRAFGQPIGAFQSVKHRIAELYGLVELSRANAIHAASLENHPGGFLKAAAAARLSGCEAYDTASRDCVQVHGGIGVTWEAGIHLHMRRARTLAIEQGSALFWEDVLVNEIVGDAA